MNPSCPNCKRIMVAKWRKTIIGEKNEGRAKFWVCKPCELRFKIGAQVISKRSVGVLSNKQIQDNTGMVLDRRRQPDTWAVGHRHKHSKPIMVQPSVSPRIGV